MTTDWARLRQVMYEPATCWLSTDYAGTRWLTDEYVLYDVTGLDELKSYDFHVCLKYEPHLGYAPAEMGECCCPEELPDGPYQVTVSKGFKPRKSVPQPDIEGYLSKLAEKRWELASPTEWSVAEHPGKAMLWTHEGQPCLLGESTWTAIRRHHPYVVVDYTSEGNVFRFRQVEHEVGCGDEGVYCGHRIGHPFAYAAGIKCPEGQELIALEVAQQAYFDKPTPIEEERKAA